MEKNEIYQRFGKHVKEFLLDKYGTIKRAGTFLKFNPALISHYIQGEKPPSRRFESEMKKAGFDMQYFDAIKTHYDLEHYDADGLNWEQMKFLVSELKEIIIQKNSVIKEKSSVIKTLSQQIDLLNGKITH